MLVSEWWQTAGACVAWIPGHVRHEILDAYTDSIDSLSPNLAQLLEILSMGARGDYSEALDRLTLSENLSPYLDTISLLKARMAAELGNYGIVIKELSHAEQSNCDPLLVAKTSSDLLGRDVNHGGTPQRALEGSQPYLWKSEIGSRLGWLPQRLQSNLTMRKPPEAWFNTMDVAALFVIILDIESGLFHEAIELSKTFNAQSEYWGESLLLRARAYAGIEQFDEMVDTLSKAVDAGVDEKLFRDAFEELSGLMMASIGDGSDRDVTTPHTNRPNKSKIDPSPIFQHPEYVPESGNFDTGEGLGNNPFFHIVITGLNLGMMLEACLKSISSQDYRSFKVHLLSDEDRSSLQDPKIIKERYNLVSDPVVKISSRRVGKAKLIYDHLIDNEFSNDDVIIFVDGDDRLATPDALSKFAAMYRAEDPDACWSSYIRTDGVLGHSAPLIRGINHRKQGWRSSHCFSFRASLFKYIPREYILDQAGMPVMQACDIALALPILDISRRTSFIPEALYIYDVANPQSHHNQSDGVGLSSRRQIETASFLYRKKPLSKSKSIIQKIIPLELLSE